MIRLAFTLKGKPLVPTKIKRPLANQFKQFRELANSPVLLCPIWLSVNFYDTPDDISELLSVIKESGKGSLWLDSKQIIRIWVSVFRNEPEAKTEIIIEAMDS